MAFISYLNLLVWPMMAIGWVTTLIQRGAASMRRINRVLHERPEVLNPPGPGNVRLKGKIEIKGLSFKYPGQSVYALRDINVAIEEGETVALAGTVGSGKSTLLQGIPRLLEVPRGTVFIDGTDAHDIPLKVLRENIGFVTQEAILFSDTIRNNVVFGREDVSQEQLLETLETAQIREEVLALENALDSILGERGITLSGGQRQRLTIARALVTDPPILILDDAFSMVDTSTEARILKKILQLRKEKTTLVVSHRVPTIERADRILVLKDGRLVEAGDHRTLLEKGTEYRRIYRRQVLAQELGIEVSDRD
ncbi:MAG: ABC transporter ATP-binding protein [Deltaproteobacteria bacterium]|nr:ABC transporter ATP-binding protein [Deltaproteobacteria bacterium]